MTREDVYRKCEKKIAQVSDRMWVSQTLLPKDAIDAIIDCAVEEALEKMKGMEE